MTPTELKQARATLGLSAAGLAKVLHLGSGRTIRRWEAGDSRIHQTLIRAFPTPQAGLLLR